MKSPKQPLESRSSTVMDYWILRVPFWFPSESPDIPPFPAAARHLRRNTMIQPFEIGYRATRQRKPVARPSPGRPAVPSGTHLRRGALLPIQWLSEIDRPLNPALYSEEKSTFTNGWSTRGNPGRIPSSLPKRLARSTTGGLP